MSKSGFVPDIEQLDPDDWRDLRDIRLSALKDSPHAFLHTYEQEEQRSEEEWRAEFDRGDWYIGTIDGAPAGLLCVTREDGAPADECYLESLWVLPEYRRAGVGYAMLTQVLAQLRADGIRTAFLWVLDGNDTAVRLYERAGFVSSNHRQPLPAAPDRSEEKMIKHLA
jgi:ribosomal protein S18 acetylase RimI-like enzyme